MNILLLTQILPYPPDAGPKVKTWHVLRYLVNSGHKVSLVSYIREEEKKYIPEIQHLGINLYTVPIKRNRMMDAFFLMRSQFTGRPFLIERDDLPAYRNLVKKLLEDTQFDVIHADQLTMTQFADPEIHDMPGLYRIFDAHNATWSIFERMQENASVFLKPVIALEAKRVKKYEGQVIRNFEHTLVVTDQDRDLLCRATGVEENGISLHTKITIIPIAVDTQQLKPIQRQPASTNIITLGTLHYPPNADGIRWFIQKVYPLVKTNFTNVTLTVIGKNPPSDFLLAASQDSSIQITGYVPDLEPYFQQAALIVVPVRAGSGMRVRILEAFSRAIPVVTTTIGLEGIAASLESDVLVGDSPEEFSSQVCRLLADPSLQDKLAENGRRLAENKYDWLVALSKLENLYTNISTIKNSQSLHITT